MSDDHVQGESCSPTEIARLVIALAENGGPMTAAELVLATGIKREQVHSRCSTNPKAGRFFTRVAPGAYDLLPDLVLAEVL